LAESGAEDAAATLREVVRSSERGDIRERKLDEPDPHGSIVGSRGSAVLARGDSWRE
jgi:hypothetical protein